MLDPRVDPFAGGGPGGAATPPVAAGQRSLGRQALYEQRGDGDYRPPLSATVFLCGAFAGRLVAARPLAGRAAADLVAARAGASARYSGQNRFSLVGGYAVGESDAAATATARATMPPHPASGPRLPRES